jgi:hypothetical protein
MVLTASVPLGGVKGRFDHFASGKGQVFVSGGFALRKIQRDVVGVAGQKVKNFTS